MLRMYPIVGLWIAACRGPEEPSIVVEPAHGTAERARPQQLGPLERFEKATTVHMPAHFADVLEIHGAIVRGALGEAQAAAKDLLANRAEATLADWAPYVFAMNDAATEVARAGTLEAAGLAASELARTCGDCHLALGVRIAPHESDPPAVDSEPDAIMRRHKWAFDRLLEGIVTPSERAWSRGVAAYVDLPPCSNDPSSERDIAVIARVRETARAAESGARNAHTLVERAQAYGALLPTCATCHDAGC